MPRFRVLIHCRNLRLNFDGNCQRTGFYTQRFSDGETAVEAGDAALQAFRESKKYLELLDNSSNPPNEPPMLLAEEIKPAQAGVDFEKPPGLAFYNEFESKNLARVPQNARG